MAFRARLDVAEIYYGNVDIAAVAAADSIPAYIKAFIGTASKVENVHADTFDYTQDESSTTDFINQLTKRGYHIESEAGDVSVAFSIGEYNFQTKADLMGGTATDTSWTRSRSPELIYKSLLFVTRDRTYFFFPRMIVDARPEMIESKVHGLAVSWRMMDTGSDNVPVECQYEEAAILAVA